MQRPTKITTIPLALAAFTLTLLAAGAAEPATLVPLGHPNFLPTPERPIGHRGDGQGYFPGARPPAEFWTGTPRQIKMAMDTTKDWEGGRKSEATVWDYDPAKPKNILWEVALPAWANTQPLVVGRKVFSYGEPDVLFCNDADTGALLWQQRLSPWFCAGLPETAVARAETLADVWYALEVYSEYRKKGPGTTGRKTPSVEEFEPIHTTFAKTCIPRMVEALTKAAPEIDWATAANNTVQQSDHVLNIYRTKKKSDMPRLETLEAVIGKEIRQIGEVRVQLETPWGHMVGHQMSCPVSDGNRLYIQMGQG